MHPSVTGGPPLPGALSLYLLGIKESPNGTSLAMYPSIVFASQAQGYVNKEKSFLSDAPSGQFSEPLDSGFLGLPGLDSGLRGLPGLRSGFLGPLGLGSGPAGLPSPRPPRAVAAQRTRWSVSLCMRDSKRRFVQPGWIPFSDRSTPAPPIPTR